MVLGKEEKEERLILALLLLVLPIYYPLFPHLLLGDRRPPVSRWLDEPERMEQEAVENRDPEKPEVCELGLRLRSRPGAGDEEAGEGPALVPSGWQPEEEVEPLPRSNLELESGKKGQKAI